MQAQQQQQQQQQQAAEEEVPNGVLPVAELMNGTTENANETDSKVVVENEPVIENEKTGNNTEDIIEIEQNVIPKEVNSPTKQAEVEIQEVETKISEDSNGKDVSMSVDDVDESESESEAEEELNIDLTKEVEIDLQELDSITTELLDVTEDYNVERLEVCMARLMDVIWKDRNNWNKIGTLENLKQTIKSLETTL